MTKLDECTCDEWKAVSSDCPNHTRPIHGGSKHEVETTQENVEDTQPRSGQMAEMEEGQNESGKLRTEITRLRRQIILAAQALVEMDTDEAYHRLYEAMDPNFEMLRDPFTVHPLTTD